MSEENIERMPLHRCEECDATWYSADPPNTCTCGGNLRRHIDIDGKAVEVNTAVVPPVGTPRPITPKSIIESWSGWRRKLVRI